jgi:hypothetical protein
MDQLAAAARLRRAAILLTLAILGITAVRSAAVDAWAEDRPALASGAWANHPGAMLSSALASIGQAAAQGRPPDARTLHMVTAAAQRAPLAPEPFLVAGTEALGSGRLEQAGRLLQEARRRDPRAVAPRVLLADLYLRERRTAEGLQELAALSRLAPGGPDPVVRAVAAYAREPGTEPHLLRLFKDRPDLVDPSLALLSADPRMVDRVLALAGPSAPAGHWQAVLVDALVRDGQFARARHAWARFTDERTSPDRLVDPTFAREKHGLPPFDWTFDNEGGLAEPRGGALHVLTYGREEGSLASQLLTLTPGTYRLSFRITRASEGQSLVWRMTCVPANSEVARLSLPGRSGQVRQDFTIRSTCPAQRLELRAQVNAFGRPSEATIDQLAVQHLTQ